MKPAEPTAVGYVRVSTLEQTTGFGLEIQRQAIIDYCAREHLDLTAILDDGGISGTASLEERPALSEALARIAESTASLLVVYRLDRLARDLLLQETILERLRADGGNVVSVSEPDIDSDDPTRVLVRHLLGAIAQYERALIRGRLTAGAAAKKAAGGYAGGRPGFGQRAANSSLEIDRDELATIDLARDLRRQGLTLRQVAARLDELGRLPKQGGRWHAATVRRLIV